MVKCEKTEYGYNIVLKGTAVQLVNELSYAVASLYVNAMKRSPILAIVGIYPKVASKAIAISFSDRVKKSVLKLMDESACSTQMVDRSRDEGGSVQ